MLRQVRPAVWNTLVASKGSQQAKDQFLRDVNNFRNDWAKRKQAWGAKWKGNLTSDEALAEKAALDKEKETTLLGFGFYEEVTKEQQYTEFHDSLLEAIKERPDLVLRVITSITNHYRSQQPDKAALTEAQVKTRLLA